MRMHWRAGAARERPASILRGVDVCRGGIWESLLVGGGLDLQQKQPSRKAKPGNSGGRGRCRCALPLQPSAKATLASRFDPINEVLHVCFYHSCNIYINTIHSCLDGLKWSQNRHVCGYRWYGGSPIYYCSFLTDCCLHGAAACLKISELCMGEQ